MYGRVAVTFVDFKKYQYIQSIKACTKIIFRFLKQVILFKISFLTRTLSRYVPDFSTEIDHFHENQNNW